MKQQNQIVNEMSQKELLFHLYLTQIILLFISIVIGLLIFNNEESFYRMWKLKDMNILYYGGGNAVIVLIIDALLTKLLPKEMYSDGGINERIFQGLSFPHLLFLTLLIAFVEEILFRGIIQTQLGLITASIFFAILHFRYLSRWALFTMVVLISFLIGVIFEVTGNLWVTIFSHFLIDFISAIIIKLKFCKDPVKE